MKLCVCMDFPGRTIMRNLSIYYTNLEHTLIVLREMCSTFCRACSASHAQRIFVQTGAIQPARWGGNGCETGFCQTWLAQKDSRTQAPPHARTYTEIIQSFVAYACARARRERFVCFGDFFNIKCKHQIENMKYVFPSCVTSQLQYI